MPAPFRLSPPERRELKRIGRSQSGRADDVRRARIILGLAGGQTLAAISRSQSCSVNTVKLWRERFLRERISGLWGRHLGKAVAPAPNGWKPESLIGPCITSPPTVPLIGVRASSPPNWASVT
jgi:hypothetical protein